MGFFSSQSRRCSLVLTAPMLHPVLSKRGTGLLIASLTESARSSPVRSDKSRARSKRSSIRLLRARLLGLRGDVAAVRVVDRLLKLGRQFVPLRRVQEVLGLLRSGVQAAVGQ